MDAALDLAADYVTRAHLAHCLQQQLMRSGISTEKIGL